MSDKYIMILGAGLMQKPSIEAARELGYKTLVVDANSEAVCVPFADRFEPVDLKDREGLARLALSMKDSIEAVFTAGTDFSASVSYVAEKLGLKSHSFESALNASEKTRMRSCFEKASVPSPSFEKITRSNLSSYLESGRLSKIDFPKVVKPVDNMGARGCRLIRCQKEFLSSVEDAVRYSRTGTAILEDYMKGPEFSIDSVVYSGTLTITGFADRHIFYEPYFIEIGHTMPTAIDDSRKKELIAAFAKGIHALGLSCGVAKADIKYTEKGPMIGEIAARLSGGYMSGWTYPYASDLNLTKQAMLIALGREPKDLLERRKRIDIDGLPFEVYEVPCTHVSAERAWMSIPGVIKEILNLDAAKTEPFVKNVLPRVFAGDNVDFPRNNVEKCGNVISLSEDYALAVKAAEHSVSSVVLRLEKNNLQTENYLSRAEKSTEKNFPPDAFVLSDEDKTYVKKYAEKISRIKKNSKTSKLLDVKFCKFAENISDFNHRSMMDTLTVFDKVCPVHDEMDAVEFFDVLVRGGIQGLLYKVESAGN